MYGIADKLLALLFSGALLLQAYLVKTWIGTYLAPAALFPLAWFVFTIFPLVFLFAVPINALSIGYIWLCALAFSLSALPFNWRFALKTNSIAKAAYEPNFGSRFIRRCLYLSAILSVVFSLWTMVINGWSLEEILFDLLVTSGRFAALRGNEGVEYGLIGTLSIFFTYLCPALGGLVASVQSTTRARIGFFVLAVAPAIFTMVTQSQKLIFLHAMCFYLAAIMLAKIYTNKLAMFRARNLPKVLLVMLLLFPFVLVSILSREHYYSDLTNLTDAVRLLTYALSSYAFGQIYAFADFFSFYVGMPAMSAYKSDFGSLGAYTFASVFDTLGIGKDFPPSLYEETGYFPDVFETPIFTALRGLILDFGGVGSVVFMFVAGLVANMSFYSLLVRRKSWFAATVYVVAVVAMLMGYVISVFMARYMILNAFAFYAILKLNSVAQRQPAEEGNGTPASGGRSDMLLKA
jgi:oligosaccharide repeat unit polymerase